MKPRDFLNYFKTKSGRLTLFCALFAGGLIIFGVLREKHSPKEIAVSKPGTNVVDKPQIVQSVNRPFQTYDPPAPKQQPVTVAPVASGVSNLPNPNPPRTPAPEPPAPIALFADS